MQMGQKIKDVVCVCMCVCMCVCVHVCVRVSVHVCVRDKFGDISREAAIQGGQDS